MQIALIRASLAASALLRVEMGSDELIVSKGGAGVHERLGPYIFTQDSSARLGQRLTADSLLLADFVRGVEEADSVMDIGCGAGALTLLLAWKTKARRIVGVEVEPNAAALARRNVEANGLGGRVEIVEADYRALPTMYGKGAFSVVVSNPPYVKAGAGRVSPDRARALARSEVMGTLNDLVRVSSHLIGDKGRLFYIFPEIRRQEMIAELKSTGFEAARIEAVPAAAGKRPELFMVEGRR